MARGKKLSMTLVELSLQQRLDAMNTELKQASKDINATRRELEMEKAWATPSAWSSTTRLLAISTTRRGVRGKMEQ